MAWVVTKSAHPYELDGRALLLKEEAVGRIKTLAVSSVVGAARELHIDSIRIDYTATATAGTRTLRVQVLEGAAVLLSRILNVATNLTLSQQKQVTLLADQRAYEAAGGEHFDFLPPGGGPLKVFGGLSVVVEDYAAIDAADTCKVYVRASVR
jgi:hypothetical protein